MRLSERQLLVKRVVQYFKNIAKSKKRETVSHFETEGFKKVGGKI